MKKKAPIPDNFTETYIAVNGIEESVSYTHLACASSKKLT